MPINTVRVKGGVQIGFNDGRVALVRLQDAEQLAYAILGIVNRSPSEAPIRSPAVNLDIEAVKALKVCIETACKGTCDRNIGWHTETCGTAHDAIARLKPGTF